LLAEAKLDQFETTKNKFIKKDRSQALKNSLEAEIYSYNFHDFLIIKTELDRKNKFYLKIRDKI
jgi:hypothetical protein